MDIRILQYFLAVTREKSILGAANSLHISQPSLSRQLKELENELGKTLFLRSNRHITLTKDGLLLQKRAEEIISLMEKTTNELMQSDVSGDIYIGSGESSNIEYIIKVAKKFQTTYPNVKFHIISGDRKNVMEDLDNGLIDFGILFGSIDDLKYECLKIPATEQIGVLMRKDDKLADKEITLMDLKKKPLILSRQMYKSNLLEDFNRVGTYNLLYNGSIMVQNKMGYAICFDKIINTTGDSPFLFKPLDLKIDMNPFIVWKKYQVFSIATQKFKDALVESLNETIDIFMP